MLEWVKEFKYSAIANKSLQSLFILTCFARVTGETWIRTAMVYEVYEAYEVGMEQIATQTGNYWTIGDSNSSVLRLPFSALPIISLDKWFNGNEEEQLKVARTVNWVCRNSGFMYLKDHGVAEQTIAGVLRAAQV